MSAIPKPFEPIVRHGDLLVDRATGEVFVRARPIFLTMFEYRLLLYFLHNAGRVITCDDLLASVWNGHTTKGTIYTCLKNLRRKVGRNAILTLQGQGYLLQEEAK